MANPFVHVELNTTDVDKAKKFYSELFDWELEDMSMGPSGTYTVIKVGEGTGGGLLKNPMPGVPSFWLAYVLVDDIGAATKKAASLGAKIVKDSIEVPDMGWLSILADPTGAALGLWQTKNPDKMSILRKPSRLTSERARISKGEIEMRFMVIVKADENSEAGVMPSKQLLTDMGKFNEELANAGVMLAGEGLHPSSKGVRVKFSGGNKSVIDGPFAETKELVAGFWLWKCKSLAEAIEWLKRAPFEETEVEIRQVFEAEDFGAEFTPELREQEARIREQVEAKQ